MLSFKGTSAGGDAAHEAKVNEIVGAIDRDFHSIFDANEFERAFRGHIVKYGEEDREALIDALNKPGFNTCNFTTFGYFMDILEPETFNEILNVLGGDFNTLHNMLTPADKKVCGSLSSMAYNPYQYLESEEIVDTIFNKYEGHKEKLKEMLTKKAEEGTANINGVMRVITPESFKKFLDAYGNDVNEIHKALSIKDGEDKTCFVRLANNRHIREIFSMLLDTYEGHYDLLRDAFKEVVFGFKTRGMEDGYNVNFEEDVFHRMIRTDNCDSGEESVFNKMLSVYEGQGEELRTLMKQEHTEHRNTFLHVFEISRMPKSVGERLISIYEGGAEQIKTDKKNLRPLRINLGSIYAWGG